MAKDPAFLFYPGDWLGGTMGMTFEQKGAYFELLVFQFNNGPFTEAQAQQVLSICSASVWQVVKHKFIKTGDRYANRRLADEIEKRKAFSESRRNNAKAKKQTHKNGKAYAQHMENINEDEIEISRLKVWGDEKGPQWFTVKCPYATGNHHKVFGVDGYKKFAEANSGKVKYPQHLEKFLREKDGSVFEGTPSFVFNSFNKFVKEQFK